MEVGRVITPGEDGVQVLRREADMSPGAEQGLASKNSYGNMSMSFEVNIKNDTCFVAKILQASQLDQKANSYHLMYQPNDCYLARHNHIFARLQLNTNTWEKLDLAYDEGEVSFFHNEKLLLKVCDGKLRRGYAFLGIKAGEAHLKNVVIAAKPRPSSSNSHANIEYKLLHDFTTPFSPVVSIITTVYDRVECLRNCIKSLKRSTFHNYEHIIVSDCPPDEVLDGIKAVVQDENESHGRICYINLLKRHNNWGIAPATVGLGLAQGDYVGFLSDDNGYAPDHIETLVHALEQNAFLGFAYSSCLYDGRGILRSPIPRPGQIDLGQPLFRRELFVKYLHNKLPFSILAWDWQMIDFFMRKGVKWKHINKPSFLFRLNRYPQFLSA